MNRFITITVSGALAAAVATALVLVSCESSPTAAQPPGEGDVAAGDEVLAMAPTSKGGAQLWAENCMRCHNSRSPASYSDAEWGIIMHHMRVRASLTAAEHEIILKFLRASNTQSTQ